MIHSDIEPFDVVILVSVRTLPRITVQIVYLSRNLIIAYRKKN